MCSSHALLSSQLSVFFNNGDVTAHFQVEASFRMAKSDLRARPIYHRKRDSIEAHLTIVLAALAISRNIEYQTGISIKQFVKNLRPIRSGVVTINGAEVLAEPEIPLKIQSMVSRLSSGH